jgi:hypothetical protein
MGGTKRADLNAVIANLSRNSEAALRYFDSDPRTELRFVTGNAGGNLAVTEFMARITNQWRNLDHICNSANPNYALGKLLNRKTPIRITIRVDRALHNVGLANHQITATLTHEIAAHAIDAYVWLKALRSGAHRGVTMRSHWRTSNKPGALLNLARQHRKFGRGQNRAYNITARQLHASLPVGAGPGPGPRALFWTDVHQDMDAHVPPGVVPNYPI